MNGFPAHLLRYSESRAEAVAKMAHTECDPGLFQAAWHVNLGILYFHGFSVLAVFLLRPMRGGRLTWMASLGGYLLTVFVVMLLWLLVRQPYACVFGVTASAAGGGGGLDAPGLVPVGSSQEAPWSTRPPPPPDHQRFLYINAVAFPALDACLLAHFALEVWLRWRALLEVRHWVALGLGATAALLSMLWFHAWWHLLLSLLLGGALHTLWRTLLQRWPALSGLARPRLSPHSPPTSREGPEEDGAIPGAGAIPQDRAPEGPAQRVSPNREAVYDMEPEEPWGQDPASHHVFANVQFPDGSLRRVMVLDDEYEEWAPLGSSEAHWDHREEDFLQDQAGFYSEHGGGGHAS